MGTLTAKRYSFADFELDGQRRRLYRDGEAVELKSRTFDLLLALVERQGQVLSKDDLLETVWAGQFVEEGNLTVHISALRKALGEKKNEHRYIVTVPGRGYSFVAELINEDEQILIESHSLEQIVVEEEICGDDDGPNAQAATAVSARTLSGRIGRYRLWVGIAFLLLVPLVVFGGFFWLRRSSERNAGLPPPQMSIKRLTNKGTVSRAAISPDGKLFVFAIPDGDKDALWLGHVDGGEPVQIRPSINQIYLSLKFSPDGSHIYYTAGENFGGGNLYRIPVFGGTPEVIINGYTGFGFTPDAKGLTYLQWDDSLSSMVVEATNLDGSEPRRVATLPNTSNSHWGGTAWSPDGSTIALILAVEPYDVELYFMDPADGATRQLAKKVWRELDAITWLHDGSGLIAAGIEKDSSLRQLWFVGFPGGETRRLTNDLTDWGYVASVANDNSLLAIQGINQSNIWTGPANNLSEARQVTFGTIGKQDGWNGLVWTPDGRIVYASNTNDGSTLSIMNADGSEAKQLIPNGGESSYPSVTSDGRTVVFQSNRGGHYSVWRVDIDGGELTQITGGQPAVEPFISPDGKWITFISEGELWRVAAGGGEPIRLTDRPAAWAQISPDSKLIACGLNIDGADKLGILSLETGEVVKSFDTPRMANLRLGVHWTPDGRSVTYRDWANGIWKQNLDGGEPERMAGLPAEKLFGYGWSPDGRNFAFSRGATTRDVVLVTNFRGF